MGNYWPERSTGSGLPSQDGNAGEILITDGTDASWATAPIGASSTATTKPGQLNTDVFTNGKDILLDAQRVLFGTVIDISSSGSNTLYYTDGSTSPLAMAKFSVAEGSLYFQMDGGSAQGTAFETNLGLMGSGNSIIVDTEGGPYTVVLTSGFTYSEGGYYNATTSWPDGQGFTVFAGGSDTYTLSSTSYVVTTDNSGLGTTHPVGTNFHIGSHVFATASAVFSGSSITFQTNPGVAAGDLVYDYSLGNSGIIYGPKTLNYGIENTPSIEFDVQSGRINTSAKQFSINYTGSDGTVSEDIVGSTETFLTNGGIYTNPNNVKYVVGNVADNAGFYTDIYNDLSRAPFAFGSIAHDDSYGPLNRSAFGSFSLIPNETANPPGHGSINLSMEAASKCLYSYGAILGGHSWNSGGTSVGANVVAINSSGNIYGNPDKSLTAIGGRYLSSWAKKLPDGAIITGDYQCHKISSIKRMSTTGASLSINLDFVPTLASTESLKNTTVVTSKFLYSNTAGAIVSGTITSFFETGTSGTTNANNVVTYDRKDISSFSITFTPYTYSTFYSIFSITGTSSIVISTEIIEDIRSTATSFMDTSS